MKKNNKKGFTLAELLIVVAIIAVLVAIAIPVFTSQLEKSREATDLSNIRSAYAEAMADYLANGANTATSATGNLNQKEANWAMGAAQAVLNQRINGVETPYSLPNYSVGKTTFSLGIDSTGSVSVTFN
ncbi:MAG: type II secretion system protein [Clostridia bacterium]|nr:type II secretion system protein [Clostridia bacterium]